MRMFPRMPIRTVAAARRGSIPVYTFMQKISERLLISVLFFALQRPLGRKNFFCRQVAYLPNNLAHSGLPWGALVFLPWEYRTLETLPAGVPVFALETGGTPITSFLFPQQGVVLLGSEELGLSAEALKKASAGIVSIPMKGIKASLNVAVAFGILMQYWTAAFDF